MQALVYFFGRVADGRRRLRSRRYMRITTTDGQDYEMPDMCSCCLITTGGEHEANCPCRENKNGSDCILLSEEEETNIFTKITINIADNRNSYITKSSTQKVIYIDGKDWTSDSWIFNSERVSFTN